MPWRMWQTGWGRHFRPAAIASFESRWCLRAISRRRSRSSGLSAKSDRQANSMSCEVIFQRSSGVIRRKASICTGLSTSPVYPPKPPHIGRPQATYNAAG